MFRLNKKISATKTLLPLALLTGLLPTVWGICYSLQSYKVVCAGTSILEPSNIKAAVIVAVAYLPLLTVCLFFYKNNPQGKSAISTAFQLVIAALILTLAIDFYIGDFSHLTQPLSCSQGLRF